MSDPAAVPTGSRASGLALPRLPARLAQIDILKGLAIIAVLLLHALPPRTLHGGATVFYIGQAVPMFVVLMGLGAYASGARRVDENLPAQYPGSYFARRFERLYLPFAVVLIVSFLIASAKGTLTPGSVVSPFVGTMPFSGPGNYYITFVFQFALAVPIYCWAYRRRRLTTTVVAFAFAAGLDIIAPHVGQLTREPYTYVYSAVIIRFLPYIALGVVIGDWMLRGGRVPRWWWLAGLVSVAYLCGVQIDKNTLALDDPDWREWGETFIGAFYPALLVAVGLHRLPRVAGSWLSRALVALGQASYEVFLVQILYFGLTGSVSAGLVVPSLIACCGLGYLLHQAMRVLTPLLRQSLRRRLVA